MRRAAGLVLALASCGPTDPCRSSEMHLPSRYATRYAGHWVVAHGDTLTLPQMGDRFKLSSVTLDTARVAVGRTCRFRGALVFQAPRAETLAVTWLGQPEQALIYGWPAELGPFAGIGAVEAVRANTLPLLRRMTDRDWKKTGRHTESGRYATEDWLAIYAEHLEKHSRQIERNLAEWKSR